MKTTCSAAFLAFFLTVFAYAADSPDFRGPARDGIFPEKGLLKAWPAEGPALAWKAENIGQGYSSVSIVNGVVYTLGMTGADNQGYLIALDEKTGKELWRVAYGEETLDKMATGSRGTPTIDGDRIYLMSGLGLVACHALKDGKQLWKVDVVKQFNGATVMWVMSESLLIDGDLVFAAPGGKDAGVVALDKMSGKLVWQSKGLDEASAYCSPIIYDFGGKRELITMLAKSVVALDPKTGETLWTHPHKTSYDIHANTPVRAGNVMYYTAGYGSGGGAIEVAADGKSVKQLWLDKNLDCQHHGVVLIDGYIYGTGMNKSKLFCIELATGKIMWQATEVTQGDTIAADGMLYVYETKSGKVNLVKVDPQKFESAGSFLLPKSNDKHWAHPAIANGKLYLRNAGVVYAYNIAAK